MANTQNLDLVKPLGTDHALVSVLNSNSDKIDAYAGAVNAGLDGLRDGLGILANGNTHAAITSGQFVYVKNHQTLPEGLYQATTNIAANGTLSTSNLTADPKGGLNTLSEQIGNITSMSFSFDGIFTTANIASVLQTNNASIPSGKLVVCVISNQIGQQSAVLVEKRNDSYGGALISGYYCLGDTLILNGGTWSVLERLVSKNVTISSSITNNTWITDPFDLPSVSSGRNIYTIYSVNHGAFYNLMKRSSDQKIVVSGDLSSSDTVYISGIGG